MPRRDDSYNNGAVPQAPIEVPSIDDKSEQQPEEKIQVVTAEQLLNLKLDSILAGNEKILQAVQHLIKLQLKE